jgi:uncharacterized protein (TIGR02996 family)
MTTANVRQRLEDALAANPDDLGAHMAYADLLAEQGDPRGEFIQLQIALEDPNRQAPERKRLLERERELLEAHQRDWLGDLARYVLDQEEVAEWMVDRGLAYQLRWARGWVDRLQIPGLSTAVARAVNAVPLLRLLRELVIHGEEYDDPGYKELLGCRHLGRLRLFQLGLESGSCHTDGRAAVALVRQVPRLEELYLFAHGVDTRTLFALPLPHLRALTVDHLTEYPLEVLAANPSLGRLARLSFWPHMLEPDDDSAYITRAGAVDLLHSPHLTGLTHLTLRQSDLGDEGCTEVVRSGILKRLKVLDLTAGTVTDAGARTLAGSPDLRRLERLALTRNYLTATGIKALVATGVRVDADNQFDPSTSDELEYLWDGDME